MKINNLICLLLVLVTSCKSTISVDHRDDFRSMDDQSKAAFLKQNNAASENRSVLLLTQGFKGEKIILKQNDKTISTSYPITDLNTKIASFFSFSNESNLLIFDNYSKKDIIIPFKKAQKYKFIYLKKEYKDSVATYLITYSNTLRPLE